MVGVETKNFHFYSDVDLCKSTTASFSNSDACGVKNSS